MKTRILPFLALFLALAAPSWAEAIKLKYQQLRELNIALTQLDGAQRVVDQGKDAEGKPKPAVIVFTAYEMGGKTRLAIARNVATLKPAVDAFAETAQSLLKQVSPGAPEKVEKDPELLAKFNALWTEATKDPVTVDLTKLSEDELKLDANAVPPSILTALLPILK